MEEVTVGWSIIPASYYNMVDLDEMYPPPLLCYYWKEVTPHQNQNQIGNNIYIYIYISISISVFIRIE